ncbi:MAG: hypothetical protein ABR508_07685 [Candidatus Baltobacteraceae bacterium]
MSRFDIAWENMKHTALGLAERRCVPTHEEACRAAAGIVNDLEIGPAQNTGIIEFFAHELEERVRTLTRA